MITIIQRYYLREFFKLFTLIALGLGVLLSLLDLVDKIDDFVGRSPSIGVLLLYSALNVPRYLVYLMPMAALMSSLFVFGQAGKRRETVAFKASGGSIKGLLIPFLYSGILLCVAGFAIGEFIAPDFSTRAHRLRDTITQKKNVLAVKEGTAWLRAGDYVIKIDLYLPEKKIIQGINIMRIEEDILTERIDADSGEWQPSWQPRDQGKALRLESLGSGRSRGGIWYLKNATVYDVKTGAIRKFKEIPTDIIDSPDILGKGMQKPEEMNARELFSYTKRLKEAGIKNTKLLVDIYSRLSYPFINLIMVVLGISLSTRGDMKSGLITTAVGIFISLLYWLGYTASLSMGYTGILPPVFAAWLIPVIFGGAAFYLFKGIPE